MKKEVFKIGDLCPNCKQWGDISVLQLIKGKYGSFWACPIRCGFKQTTNKALYKKRRKARYKREKMQRAIQAQIDERESVLRRRALKV